MIEVKNFLGVLNTDDKEQNIAPSEHIQALNLRFYGGKNGLTAFNVEGNTQIPNSLPSGTNECIGALFDQVKQRIYWLNYNSRGRNGIYFYDIETGVITPLLVCFTNSTTDILGFNPDYPATDMHIIYTTETDGDILDWNCRNKRPKTLNILQAQNNQFGSNWLESYLDVASEPPSIPIHCAYENDNTAIVNNLRKKLFRFKYRYWYADNTKSTWSAISEIPVPYDYINPQVDTDPTKNCRIGCVVQTGAANVTKIEIAAQESLGVEFSNFFSVTILNKTVLAIPSNDVYIFRFYNNEAYVFVDVQESLLPFSYVPDRANSQELLNGNVRIYGGIQEGYDPVVPNVTITADTEYPLAIDCHNTFLVTQNGVNGFQTGNIKMIVLGTISLGQVFTVKVKASATLFTITYTAKASDTPADVLTGLSTSATGQGFAQVSITSDTLIISRTGQELELFSVVGSNQTFVADFTLNAASNQITAVASSQYLALFKKGVKFFITNSNLVPQPEPFVVVSATTASTNLVITVEDVITNSTLIAQTLYIIPAENESVPAYESSSKENWGIKYFDEKGKTDGVITKIPNFSVSTKYLGMTLNLDFVLWFTPYLNISVAHQPPIWAKSFQFVRSSNLTKQNYVQWISDRTYKDEKYAYISIEGLNAYKKLNPTSIISYEFLAGDRISFYILYGNSSRQAILIYNQSEPHDYEIVGTVENPDIAGKVQQGLFVKINLPNTQGLSAPFNFSDGVTQAYNNYYIELYTPTKSASEGLDVYYEIGEEYLIGNPGVDGRFHQGMLQNQTTDYITPATFKFDRGDAWYRQRRVPLGNTITYDFIPGYFASSGQVLGQKQTLLLYENNQYTTATQIDQQAVPPSQIVSGGAGWTISNNNEDVKFRIQIFLNLTSQITTPVDFEIYLTGAVAGSPIILIGSSGGGGCTAGQNFQFNFDQTITINANKKLYVVFGSFPGNIGINLISGYMKFTQPEKDYVIGVVDKNFSDFYTSSVNSNGRPDTVHPDEKTNFFGTLLRWSNPYQQNTNINQVNIFYPQNFDEIDRSKGDIQRLKSRERILRVFQNRGVGQYGVYAKYIQNNNGNGQLVTTNDILTKDNINYYLGEYGMGTQYSSLVSCKNTDYFVDPVRGYQIRLSNDGMIPISELYKGQFYIRSLLIPYNLPHQRTNGFSSKILGCYNFIDEEWYCILQEATDLNPYTFSFNEKRNSYSSFFNIYPEWMLSAEDVMYAWKDGQLWQHNPNAPYCNFFGTQYNAEITVVFNMNLFEKKTWENVSELASDIWECALIWTNTNSYHTQRQESILIEQDFAIYENMFEAAFLRDIHSQGGIVNGDWLKGNWCAIKFKKTNASQQVSITEIKVRFIDSPLTAK